ncbi:MAG: DUF4153 domain-containing protein [Paludibacter sp.]|jgi:hypothetical protein|nr:DUF4153 domain-containing protein [Paludibacter sp.]
MKRFSINLLSQKLKLVVTRFPISILCVIGFSVMCFDSINRLQPEYPDQLWLFFSLGFVISLTATLWLENFKICFWRYAATAALLLLCGIYCFFLPSKFYNIHTDIWLQIEIIGASFWVAAFFISFLKKKSDKAFWAFTKEVNVQLFIAILFGLVLYLGLVLAVYSLDRLFDLRIEFEVYLNLAVVCFILFAVIYFLANIPNKTDKYNEELSLNKVFKILGLYILIPLLGIYIIILYAYFAKTIVSWDFSESWVSSIIGIAVSCGLLSILILYPLRLQGHKFTTIFSRYFMLCLFPLFVLMSINIVKRLFDHPTIDQGYALWFNLWCYGIGLYLFISKAKQIKWIVISPVVLFLLISILPFNVASVTKYILLDRLERTLNITTQTKLTSLETRDHYLQLSSEEQQKVSNSIDYISDNYGKNTLQPYFSDDISIVSIYTVLKSDTFDATSDFEFAADFEFIETHGADLFIPLKYGVYVSRDTEADSEVKLTLIDNNKFLIVELKSRPVKIEIPVTDIVSQLIKSKAPRNLSDNEKQLLIYENDKFVVYIYRIAGEYSEIENFTINNISGYLFVK